MCPMGKGQGKRSLRKDMITALHTLKRMAIKEDDEIGCSSQPLKGQALQSNRFHMQQGRFR